MKADDINTLCKIINENYCFWFNDEIWCNIVKKIQNNCVSFYDIRKMIFKMNDPHLAISYANRDRFVFVNLVEKKETLYLDGDKKISYINDINIEEIIDKYRKDYKDNAILFLIDDLRNGNFLHNKKMVLRLKDGTTEKLKYRSFRESLNERKTLLQAYGDIYTKTINDIFLIKIPIFATENILFRMEQIIKSADFMESKNIIFDLRNNPGGRIDLAKGMIERCICGCYEYPFLFIDNKENKKKLVVYGKEKDIFKDKRIIIFINNKTSSCAEFIFAIALKNIYKDQVWIMGENTAGIGGIGCQVAIGTEYMLTYTKYRLVEKEDKNKLFDCTIIQDLCYTLSNYKQIVQIYKETET